MPSTFLTLTRAALFGKRKAHTLEWYISCDGHSMTGDFSAAPPTALFGSGTQKDSLLRSLQTSLQAAMYWYNALLLSSNLKNYMSYSNNSFLCRV